MYCQIRKVATLFKFSLWLNAWRQCYNGINWKTSNWEFLIPKLPRWHVRTRYIVENKIGNHSNAFPVDKLDWLQWTQTGVGRHEAYIMWSRRRADWFTRITGVLHLQTVHPEMIADIVRLEWIQFVPITPRWRVIVSIKNWFAKGQCYNENCHLELWRGRVSWGITFDCKKKKNTW